MRMVFSWTWYEKKKNANDTLNKATKKYLALGSLKRVIAEGKAAAKVNPVENNNRIFGWNSLCHLTTISVIHQKLAT